MQFSKNLDFRYAIVINILCLFAFCGAGYAATIFTDDFESYSTGYLNGQGGWSSAGNIYDHHVFLGSRVASISTSGGWPRYAQKSGQALTDGKITIYIARFIGWTTQGISRIELREGDNVVASVENRYGSRFYYFDGAQGAHVIFGPTFSSNTWYALQMQWRSSDHKVRFNINGGTWTDWVKGNADWTTGINTLRITALDGQTLFDNIQENLVGVEEKTPVLLVPGITGTELKEGDDVLWVNPIMANPFNDDSFMDPLQFYEDLTPSDINVESTSVIKSVIANVRGLELTLVDYIGSLVNEFAGQGYVENEDLFTFPYDWRYGVSGLYGDGKTNVDLLKEKIADILAQTGADKIDVIAHSMGGLIVKKYVAAAQSAGEPSRIGKAVFVGVPNTGAPKTVKVLVQGDNLDVLGLNEQEIKKISANMPAIYDLMPSQKYYDTAGSFVKVVNEYIPDMEFSENNLDYGQFQSYITSDYGLNSQALANATGLHSPAFDDYDMRAAGVDLYAIDGCKKPTMTGLTEIRHTNIYGFKTTVYNTVQLKAGDGTVPLASATNLPVDQSKKYYSLTGDHGKMLSQNGTRQQIVNIVSGSTLDTGKNLWLFDRITQDASKCEINGKTLIVFSPVDVSVLDQFGNQLGLLDGNITNQIENADYQIWGEHKFIFLPTDYGQTYSVTLQGTGSGTFTLKVQDVVDGQTADSENFINIPVTTSLQGTVNLSQGGLTTLTIKQTPESESETISPVTLASGDQLDDFFAPISSAVLSGIEVQPNVYKNSVSVDINAVDGNSGVFDVNYKLDNSEYQKVQSSSVSFDVLTEGAHTLAYFATDNAGNNEEEKSITFEIVRYPTNKDECKKDGWKNFKDLFKNQGDCVSYVMTDK